VVFIQ